MRLDLIASPQNDAMLIAEFEELKRNGASRARRERRALDLLKKNSPVVRNAAALALSDMGSRAAVPKIVDAVMMPGVARTAGTLLFAIEELEGTIPIRALVHLIANGSYEARQQALDLLASGHVEMDDVDSAVRQLEGLCSDASDEKAAAAQQALGLLLPEPQKHPASSPRR